ncbi:MAG: hypothetical protein J7604_25805 [Sporocytophaga sp.]|uniref:hypothetical protein n=1 Tax=Sporocytophaga sp. TaxID=2231183 RepID=UPI001B1A0099|nr:hypothetical protein [Sporocytophaga sp.]MBO9703646.1 hypothetical protein [Sporocytophaga sp.]
MQKRGYDKTKLIKGFFDEYNERGQLTRSYNRDLYLDVHLFYDNVGRLLEKKTYKLTDKAAYLSRHEVYTHNFLPAKPNYYKNFSINYKSN